MLALPTRGISRSVDSHNVKLDVLCDWIEANVLFDEEELSTTEIVSCFLNENICEESDMAYDIVSNAWTEFRRRQACIPNGTPFSISSQRISREITWSQVPAHGFCVLLSLAECYSGWAGQFGDNYTCQGKLFEELTKESLNCQFKNWQLMLTGWSRTNTRALNDIVETIASELGETVGNIKRWTSASAKDGELDLLLFRPFRDERVGVPVYLMQCASGANWESKLHTPRLKIWNKIIDFAALPRKAFAMPFALLDDDFIRNCNLVDGMLIDRYRILSASLCKKNWLSSELKRNLVDWCKPRIANLPRR